MHDADRINIAFDRPDAQTVWEHYLETCRRAGVTPVSREHADGLIAEWTATLAASRTVPPVKH